jgi:hypothetical protein
MLTKFTVGKARSRKLTDLPVEIFILIFENLCDLRLLKPPFPRFYFKPTASAILFGLASSIFYHALKRLNEISLRNPWIRVPIQDLISDFLGPNYRQAVTAGKPRHPLLLNRSVYGNQPGLQEWRLYERYKDHIDSSYKLSYRCILPNPFNMGEEWYTDAEKIIAELQASGWRKGSERLKSTYAYRSMKAKEILAAWWIEMAGL